MNNIKVIIWGFGAMGRGIAETLLSKKGVEIVGICDVNPALKNKKLSEIINCSRNSNVLIEEDIDNVLKHEADIVMLCTDSFVKGAYPKILKILSKKMNCISTAEQMAYSWASEKELSEEIDKVAKKNGVTVLGTGINPGFIMDYLVVALTGTMTDVNHIEAKRVNSLSPFGPTVMVEQGVGISLEEYKNRVSNNELAGHVGFLESVNMIAAALGVKLDDFKQQMSPIITDIERKSLYGKAKPGNLAGINMTGQGFVNGKQYINMIHPQQIEPEMVGIETGDYINI
ncbi:MAG: 2,4-diaminopentanoate dehydrogenase, partial [Bacilli bacterium]